VTSAAAACAHTRRMMSGSPAWKPQATLALVTTCSRPGSSPMVQAPNPSPTSALRSMVGTGGRASSGSPEPVDSSRRGAAMHGVSRNTLREAFRYLAKDRLVTHELNRGVFVRVPTLDDIAELYRCRRFVECAAIHGFDGNRQALDPVYEALDLAAERRAAEDW